MKQGWKYKKLGDVCNSTSNIQWSKEEKSYSYVDLTSVDRESHCITETSSVNKDNAPSRAKQWIKTGDVLFGTTRPMLKRVCLIDESYDNQVCSTGFSVLRPSDSLVPKWVFYQLLSDGFYSYIEPLQTGITYPAVSDKDVRSFVIPVPPIEEQKEICSLLDKLNLVIEKKKEQVAELDKLVQSLFYEMFGDPVTNEKGWANRPFEECLQTVKYTTKIKSNDFLKHGVFPIISQEEEYISGFWNDETDVFRVSSPVVIFGDHTRVLKYVNFDFVLGADGVKILLPISDIDAWYLFHFLKAYKIPSLGYSRHYKLLKDINLLLPPLPLQQAFAKKVKAIEQQKELINQSIKDVQTLFDAKMDYYFGD